MDATYWRDAYLRLKEDVEKLRSEIDQAASGAYYVGDFRRQTGYNDVGGAIDTLLSKYEGI